MRYTKLLQPKIRFTVMCLLALLIGTASSLFPDLWPVSVSSWIFIPGWLTYRALRIKSPKRLEAFILSFGLGLTVLIAISLAVNSLHWIINVKRPLTTHWMLVGLVTYCIALLLTNLHLNQVDITFKRPRIRPLHVVCRSLVVAWCAATIILTYLGVNLLNNTGNNILISIAVCMVVLLPLIAVFLRKKLNYVDYAIILFTMSLCLLLGSTLRSGSLFGSDIVNEYGTYEKTQQGALWSPAHGSNIYNLCLSIALLPQTLQVLTREDGLTIFKVVFQVIFSVCPVVIYLIARKYLLPIKAFLSAVLFIAFENYIGSLPNHLRQEMAFLFFALFIFVIVTTTFSMKLRRSLLTIFGLSMIVSHYSTSYVALIIMIAFVLIFHIVQRLKYLQKIQFTSHERNPLSIGMLIFFLLFTVMWYSQLTPVSGGPLVYIHKTAHNLFSSNDQNLQASGTSVSSEFKFNQTALSSIEAFEELQHDRSYNRGYTANYVAPPVSKGISSESSINSLLNNGVQLLRKIYKALTLLSIVAFIFIMHRRRKLSTTYAALLTACILAIATSYTLPSFTVDYDQERFYQQLLVILAVPSVITWYALFRKRVTLGTYCLAIFLGLYIVVSSGLSSQLIAGIPLSGKFNNNGPDYGRYYIRQGDLSAATWATENRGYRGIYTDPYGSNRIQLVAPNFSPQQTTIPEQVPNSSFVYFYSANIIQGETYLQYKSVALTLVAPTDYYNLKSNKLYANDTAAIYEK